MDRDGSWIATGHLFACELASSQHAVTAARRYRSTPLPQHAVTAARRYRSTLGRTISRSLNELGTGF